MSNLVFKCLNKLKLSWVLPILSLLWFCGCGDFFNEKSGQVESTAVLDDIRQIKKNPHVKNPLPEMYREAPKQMKVKDGVKIFYFTRHHPAEKLAEMIRNQFSKMTTDSSGKTIYAPHYIVSANSTTNQLVIQCPIDEEANKVMEFLKYVDVPPIQVNIDCLILERYADKTMDRETTIKVENLLGEKIAFGAQEKTLANFPGASLRESKRSGFGMDIGYWSNRNISGHEVRVLIDILVSQGYLKILMNPTIETVNGETAKILSRDDVPIEKIVTGENIDKPYSITEYQWVEDSLEVTPRVFADGFIGLTTNIKIGSSSKPKGVVQASVITERAINIAENRIKPGNSLVIGGLKKTEKREVLRGAPLLKDIPIIGMFFSSRDFEESGTELIFILTPSISSGGVEYSKMLEDVKKKQAPPDLKSGLDKIITDPFGTTACTRYVEQQAATAEKERTKVLQEMEQMKEKLRNTTQEAAAEKAKAAKVQSESLKARKEAEKAKADINKLKAELEKEKAKTEKDKKEADDAKAGTENVEKRG